MVKLQEQMALVIYPTFQTMSNRLLTPFVSSLTCAKKSGQIQQQLKLGWVILG